MVSSFAVRILIAMSLLTSASACGATPELEVDRYLEASTPLIFGESEVLEDWSPRITSSITYTYVGRNDGQILFLAEPFFKASSDGMFFNDDLPRPDLLIDVPSLQRTMGFRSSATVNSIGASEALRLLLLEQQKLNASKGDWGSNTTARVFIFRDEELWREWLKSLPNGYSSEIFADVISDLPCRLVEGPQNKSRPRLISIALLAGSDEIDLATPAIKRCMLGYLYQRQGLLGAAKQSLLMEDRHGSRQCILGVVAPRSFYDGVFSEYLRGRLGLKEESVAGCLSKRGARSELLTRHFELLFEGGQPPSGMTKDHFAIYVRKNWDAAVKHHRLSPADIEKLEKGSIYVGR